MGASPHPQLMGPPGRELGTFMKVLPSAPVHSTAPEWGSFRASIGAHGASARLVQMLPRTAQVPGGQGRPRLARDSPPPAGSAPEGQLAAPGLSPGQRAAAVLCLRLASARRGVFVFPPLRRAVSLGAVRIGSLGSRGVVDRA